MPRPATDPDPAPGPLPPADSATRGWNLGLAATAAAAWVAVIAITTGPYLGTRLVPSNDFHQHGAWMLRFLDAGLFPDDPVIAYFAGPAAPPLYATLYRALVPLFGGPLVAMEAVGLALAAACGWLAWRLGVWAGGRREPGRQAWAGVTPATRDGRGCWPALGGLASVLLLVWLQLEDRFFVEPVALQRAFGLPLTLGVALAMAERRRVCTGVLLVLAAGLYPVLVAGLGLLVLCVEGRRLVAERRLPPGWVPLAVGAGLALGWVLLRPSPPWLGEVVTLEQARRLPEFQAGGRQAFFGFSWEHFWFQSGRSGVGYRWERLLFSAALVAAGVLTLGRRAVPPLAWAALGTGLLLFVAAHATLFHLYLPQRHTIYAVPTFGLLAAGGIAAAGGTRLLGRVDTACGPNLLDRVGPWLAPLAAALIVPPLGARHLADFERRTAWAQTSRGGGYAALMEDLQETPRDTVVAGFPTLVNDLPHRGRRPVLVTREQSLAYHRGFYEDVVEPRYASALRIAHARTFAEADAEADRFGVDLWLTRLGHDPGGRERPERPLDTLHDRLAARPGAPALADPPAERVFARRGDWALIRVGRGGVALPPPGERS